MMRNISPHFTFEELTRTDIVELAEKNQALPPYLLSEMHALAWGLLEPIRGHYDKPVIIHRGYSCPEVNRRVKGSPTSQHLRAEAADFHVRGVPVEDVFLWIRRSTLPFGQVILYDNHIHISLGWPFGRRERQALWLRDGGYSNMEVLA